MSCKFLIQFEFFISTCTLLFLNLASLYKFGANSLGAAPWSHLASQKVFFVAISNMHYSRAEEDISICSFSDLEQVFPRPDLSMEQKKIFLGHRHVCQFTRQ
jgi:hypothetical protein